MPHPLGPSDPPAPAWQRRDPAADVVAVIPARGGSKGVPRKNLRVVGDRSLLVHAIEHALAASLVDAVIVSTDDDEIAAVAVEAGAAVVRRPAGLAADHTPTLPVLTHVLEVLRPRMPGRVVTVQPTSPLRRAQDLDAAIAMLVPDYDSVVGVCEAEHSPYKMFHVADGELHALFPNVPRGAPRQSLPLAFRENGAVYVTWRDVLEEQRSIWGRRARPYVMEAAASLDIDTLHDLALAEHLAGGRNLPTFSS